MLSSRELYDRLATKGMMVVATVGSLNKPEAALVAYSVYNGKIAFGTNRLTRKYAKLVDNPAIALVVGFDDVASLQLEGKAQLCSGEELDKVRVLHAANFPISAKHAKSPDQRYFVISLSWARLTDYSHGERIEEWHHDAD